MKNRFFLFVNLLCMSALILPGAIAKQSEKTSTKVMSFNIRYNTPNDDENAWPYRKQHVADLIAFHGASIVGLQEARLGQLKDLASLLPNYGRLGVDRDHGKQDAPGEYAAILYRKDQVKVIKRGAFWCSTTPEKPSIGWDAAFKRNVNWAELSLQNGKRLIVFNNHFDHQGHTARLECAKLLRAKVDMLAGDKPLVVLGDFNSTPHQPAYQRLVTKTPYKIALFDASKVTQHPAYSPGFTFAGFDIKAKNGKTIDYILVNNKIQVERFAVLTDSRKGRMPSDHYPLIAEISF